MKKLVAILCVAFCFGAMRHPTGTTYFVKSNGGTGSGLDDANAWSFAKLNATALSSTDVVQFKRGDTLVLGTTLNIYSGVTYRAYGTGANPVITGMNRLTSWTNVGTNLWESALSAGSTETMVTVGDSIVAPGRYPNSGWLKITTGGSNSLQTDASSIAAYDGGDVVIKKREWIIDRHPITSISGSTVNFTNPGAFPALSPEAGGYWGFYFTNKPAAVDSLNEYYYTSGTLRLWCTQNPTARRVRASALTNLVSMTGKTNVSFQDITFEGTIGTMFTINGGSGISFVNDTIQYAGTKAIDANSVSNFIMDGCVVRYTNYSAIDAVLGTNQLFKNNTFYQIGMNTTLCGPDNKANHAMFVNGTSDTIRNNIVSYTGYVGIDFGGDSNFILNNYVHHFNQTCADGGGIYTSDETNGKWRWIDHNVVVFGLGPRDGTPFAGNDNSEGVYLDEGSAGVYVTRNFLAFNSGGGMYLHKAHHCYIQYNTFYGNTLRGFYAAEDADNAIRITNIVFTNNWLYNSSSGDHVYSFIGTPTIDSFFSEMNNNTIAKPSSESDALFRQTITVTARDGGGNATAFAYDPQTYSLSAWRTAYPKYDRTSKPTPAEFLTGTPYIQTSFDMTSTIPLGMVYKSLRGTPYEVGVLTLPPFSGEVLISTGSIPTFITVPYILKGNVKAR